MAAIELKTREEIRTMRSAGRVVAEVLARLAEAIQPGMSTLDLDRMAEEWTRKAGCKPAFKGYQGFPGTLCTSVNEEVVHGIPSSKRRIKAGDIVSVDFGVILDGFYSDSATTLSVGEIDNSLKQLMDTTREGLLKGIEQARAGNRIGDIGFAVQTHCEARGYGVVRDFVGHGIGRNLHEAPQIPNYGKPGGGVRLRAGMVVCIEPMINMGTWEVRKLDDGWTIVTADGKPSAHYEHCIAITEEGPEILTQLPKAA